MEVCARAALSIISSPLGARPLRPKLFWRPQKRAIGRMQKSIKGTAARAHLRKNKALGRSHCALVCAGECVGRNLITSIRSFAGTLGDADADAGGSSSPGARARAYVRQH